MPGPNTIGIVLELDAQGAVVNARNLGNELDNVRTRAGGAGDGLRGAGEGANDFNQSIQNAIQGMQFMQQQMSAVADAVMAGFADMINAAAEFEVAMTRVSIVMGMTGERVHDQQLQEEFSGIRDRIIEIGRESEFQMGQAAEAFVNLKQAGMDATASMEMIDQVMAFSSASAGTVDLATSADTATLSLTALGMEANEVNQAMDMMVKASTLSKLSMREMPILFRSMGSTAQAFSSTSQSDFMAIASQLRQMGRSAAQVGNDMAGLERGFARLTQAIQRGGGQARRKTDALAAVGLQMSDIVDDTTGNYRNLAEILDTGGARIRQAIERDGMAATRANLLTAFGSRQAVNAFLLTMQYGEQHGEQYGGTIRGMANELALANGEAADAQQAYLETTEGMLQVLDGSVNLLKVSLGELFMSALKPLLSVLVSVVNAVQQWAVANPEIARVLGYVAMAVGALASTLAFMLGTLIFVNMATLALGPALAGLGGSFSVASFGALFFQSVLTPLAGIIMGILSFLAPFILAAGLIYVAYKKNLGGFGDFVRRWGNIISDVFSVAGPMLSGEGVSLDKWQRMHPIAQKIVIALVLWKHRLMDLWKGFKDGLTPVLEVFGSVLGWVWEKLILFAEFLGFSTAELHNGAMGTEAASTTFEYLGKVIGWLTGLYIGYKATMVTVKAVTIAWKAVVILFNGVLAIKNGLMWAGKAAIVAYKLVQVAIIAVTQGWAAAQTALNIVLAANPIGLVIMAVAALIAIVVALIVYWDELNAWIGEISGGFLDMWDIILLVLGPIGWAILAFKKLYENWDYVWQGMKNIASTVWGWITSAWDALWDPIINFGSTLYNAGRNCINSIWDGFKNAWTAVKEWFLSKIEWMTDLWPFSPVKNPESPLKKRPLDRAGSNVMGTLQEGLEQGGRGVEQAAIGVAADVGAAMEPPAAVTQDSGGSWFGGLADAVGSLVDNGGALDSVGSAIAGMFGGPQPATAGGPNVGSLVGGLFGTQEDRAATGTSTEAASVTGDSGPGATAAGSTTITVNAQVETGDFKMNVDSLDGAEAARFNRWLASKMSEIIEDELEKRNL